MHAFSDNLDATELFYYGTVYDCDRNGQSGKRRKQTTRRVNQLQKKQLVSNRFFDCPKLFEFKKLQSKESTKIESYEDLYSYLSLLPIGECMSPAIPINTYFSCRFISGNYAWISQNKQGHYRYFSKKKDGGAVSFDLIDIIELVYGVSTMKALEKALELFKIQFMEDAWRKEQKEKYLRNYQFLNSKLQKQCPVLHEYLKDCIPLLVGMNALGTMHIHKKEYAYKKENLFFASNSYIAQFLGFYTASKVSKLVNMFAVLGLIEKVPLDELHPLFRTESLKISEMRGLGNVVSYYIIHSLEAAARIAEKRAKQLKTNGVQYSNLSKCVVEKIFGTQFAQTIYVQTVQKNKKKVHQKNVTIQKSLEDNFVKTINQYGYATKTMVLGVPIADITDRQKKYQLNQIWSYLIEVYKCDYIKPSIEIKEEYGLVNFEYIALKKV
ncbi:hypothetical protein NDS46_30590 (plasmid) [Paenibacillus thiaminolyticus]|uniref:hypothetical protein n=1 Tax=Paenibacillus thiaminolyticus TaxID=49283 RepID=UPI00232C0967|nr:hypothetical protein [Paenibacillus thiaminolyticus]WCF11698.1 hypothetical protein NDS46_30590 [Paenibacillus thiaminolyticus]